MQANGPHSLLELIEIKKAFEANTATGGASPFVEVNSSGAALSMQSLDKVYVATVSSDKDFKFLKAVPRRTINQVMAEYNKNTSHGGGWYRTSYIGQSDEPSFHDAELERLYDEVNYIAEGYAFNKVVDTQQSVNDPELIQSNSALKRGMENQCRNFWFGDKSINKYAQNGYYAALKNYGSEFVSDARGQLVEIDEMKDKSARIRTRYMGLTNEAWMHPGTKSLYDQWFDDRSAGRTIQNDSQNPGQTSLSNIVRAVEDSNAKDERIVLQTDIWMDRHDWSVPMRRNDNGVYVEGPTSDTESPATPTLAVAALPATPGSKFTGTYVGAYDYRVCAGTLRHWSQASALSPATNINIPVGAGSELTITPGPSGSPSETRYAIFRTTAPGSGLIRYMIEIPRNSSGPTTVFQDLNDDLPGTGIFVLGDFNAKSTSDSDRTLVLSELLGWTKTLFPYGAGGKVRMRQGIVENYSVLQILAKEKFHVWKNVPVRR